MANSGDCWKRSSPPARLPCELQVTDITTRQKQAAPRGGVPSRRCRWKSRPFYFLEHAVADEPFQMVSCVFRGPTANAQAEFQVVLHAMAGQIRRGDEQVATVDDEHLRVKLRDGVRVVLPRVHGRPSSTKGPALLQLRDVPAVLVPTVEHECNVHTRAAQLSERFDHGRGVASPDP